MTQEKQIEEMADILCEAKGHDCNGGDDCRCVKQAEALYNAGYRKSQDVAREIFEEIEKLRCTFTYPYFRADGTIFNKTDFNFHVRIEDYNELKKKYIGENANVTTKESEKDK